MSTVLASMVHMVRKHIHAVGLQEREQRAHLLQNSRYCCQEHVHTRLRAGPQGYVDTQSAYCAVEIFTGITCFYPRYQQ